MGGGAGSCAGTGGRAGSEVLGAGTGSVGCTGSAAFGVHVGAVGSCVGSGMSGVGTASLGSCAGSVCSGVGCKGALCLLHPTTPHRSPLRLPLRKAWQGPLLSSCARCLSRSWRSCFCRQAFACLIWAKRSTSLCPSHAGNSPRRNIAPKAETVSLVGRWFSMMRSTSFMVCELILLTARSLAWAAIFAMRISRFCVKAAISSAFKSRGFLLRVLPDLSCLLILLSSWVSSDVLPPSRGISWRVFFGEWLGD